MLDDYRAIIESNASRFGVPVSWIEAVIMTESSGNARAYRSEPSIGDASYGLMQLLTSTARGLGYTGTASGLYDPATNIEYGTRLLADLQARYGSDFRRVYSAYNSGNPDRYLTSAQVGANVERALSWLTDTTAGQGTGLAVLIVLGVVAWRLTK